MKKILFGTIFTGLVLVFPSIPRAEVNVDISLSLPALVFAVPPNLVVIPETYVYAVPDLDVDIFFYEGWWWRPWKGQWYRSRNYSSGWRHYRRVPSFSRQIPSSWRNEYKEHRWKGHQWESQRIPHQQVKQNWSNWQKNKHWEKENRWGVKELRDGNESRSKSKESKPKNREAPHQSQSRHRHH